MVEDLANSIVLKIGNSYDFPMSLALFQSLHYVLGQSEPQKELPAPIYIHGNWDNEEKLLEKAAQLYRRNPKHYIVLNGMTSKESLDQRINYKGADIWSKELEKHGVDREKIFCTESSPHTYAEAETLIQLMKEKNEKEFVFISLPYHILRCTLSHRAAAMNLNYETHFYPASVQGLHWTDTFTKQLMGEDQVTLSRIKMLEWEWERIKTYQEKKNCSSIEEAIPYIIK